MKGSQAERRIEKSPWEKKKQSWVFESLGVHLVFACEHGRTNLGVYFFPLVQTQCSIDHDPANRFFFSLRPFSFVSLGTAAMTTSDREKGIGLPMRVKPRL